MIDLLTTSLLPLLDVQAGGGGSFGGGGGSFGGGGGGGDGEGLFYVFYFLIRLAIEAPLIGVPLLIVAVFLVYKGAGKSRSTIQDRGIRKRRPQVQARESSRQVELLKASDPDFDQARFLDRVQRAFEVAQKSWCAQELDDLRPFVTDGVYERFSLQIEEQREDGWRQGMSGLACRPLSVLHFDQGTHFETVTVKIPFNADIHRIDAGTGERIPGSKLPRNHFSECWSFVRRRGAKSLAGGGLMEGHCPNCGAPLEVNQSAICGSCEALVRSGNFDWVLAEITQSSEWRPESEAQLPTFAVYARQDPGISLQLLEDRTSVAFWRKVAAERRGDPSPLVRIADEDFLAKMATSLARKKVGDRTHVADNAVGSVRCLGFQSGAEKDRAIVEVLYDGVQATVNAKGERRLGTNRRLRRELFVFERPAGARSDLDDSLSTSRCRSCGAHDAGGTDPRCPYCESPRTGDESNWMLHEILPEGSGEAKGLRRALQEGPRVEVESEAVGAKVQLATADLLSWAAVLAKSDGHLHPAEIKAIHELAEANGLSEARIAALIDVAQDDGVAPQPRDSYEARLWLRTLIQLALSDSSISSGERRFLKHAAEHLGIGSIELGRLVKRVRGEMYRDSKRGF